MAIDTSTSPYFDDYDVGKNYVKILYKPGLAVQARELNQSQSILQNQIKTLADTLFTDGDSVSGLETSKSTTNKNFRAVRLKPTFNGQSINVNSMLGKYVTCTQSLDEYLTYDDFYANLVNKGYDITLTEIRTIADYFSGQELLYTIDSINYYKLHRKPRVNELTYWVNRYLFTYNKTINAAFKQEFILKVTADNFEDDANRIIDDSKNFLSGASNDSVFYYTTFIPYKLVGEVVQVYAADDPTPGDPPTLIIKTISAFADKSFPSGDTLLFYDSVDNAFNKVSTGLKAFTIDDIVFTTTGSFLASETILTLESPNFDIKVGDYIYHPNLFEKLYITKINSSISFTVNSLPRIDLNSVTITVYRKNTVPTLRITVGAGMYYKSGYMIRCEEQSIIPEKYNAWPFKSVGLDLVEEIITSNDDSSLLDPALESSNYLATGSDRLKLSLVLNSYDLIDGVPDVDINYKELKRFFNGIEDPFETRNVNTLIRKELAERTYDESGNYTVNPIKFQTLPSSPFSKYFDVKLLPINCYIGGFNVRTSAPINIPIEKETSFETISSYNVVTNSGNYHLIESLSKGFIDTNNLKQANIFVEFHNSYNVSASTKLGDGAVRSIEYVSGLGSNTQFKMNYFAISALEGKDLLKTTHIIGTKNIYTANPITTWSAWTATYGYSETDGRAVSTAFYKSSALLGTNTSKNYYGLYRDPDAEGLAYWTNRYINVYNRVINSTLKNEFIASLIAAQSSDTTRSLLETKDYYYAPAGTVFYAGTVVTDYNQANIYFRANVAGIVNGNVTIYDTNPFDVQIYPTNQINVKSIQKINFESVRVIKGATFSNGVYVKTFGGASAETFTFGDGTIPRTAAAAKVQVLIVSGNTANTSLGVFNFSSKGTFIVSGSSKTMSIDLNDSSFNGKADIMFTVDVENISPRVKTRNYDEVAIVDIALVDYYYSLLKADVASFKGIYKIGANTWTGTYNFNTNYYTGNVVLNEGRIYVANTNSSGRNVTDTRYWNSIQAENSLFYYFDDGQRDTFYDHGYVKYIGDPNKAPGRCLVLFDYYTHTGEGPVTAESYPSIFNILPYRSTVTSRYYDLRNSLDFRPIKNNDSRFLNIPSYLKPTMNSLTEIDISYYLSRIDKIYITNRTQNVDGSNIKFKRDKGAPAVKPVPPKTSNNPLVEMLIGTVFVPAFTAGESTVVCVPENITRATMQDINLLAKRVENVEKRVRLHDLDIIALKSKIFNDGGEELLKSGIFLDDFSTINKLNIGKNTLGITINTKDRVCLPSISSFNFRLTPENTNNILLYENKLAVMKYTEEEFCGQKLVSVTTETKPAGNVNVNPGGSTFGGRVVILPMASSSIVLNPISAVKAFTEYDNLNKFLEMADNFQDDRAFVVTKDDGTTGSSVTDPVVVDGIPVDLDLPVITDTKTPTRIVSDPAIVTTTTDIIETIVCRGLVDANDGNNILTVGSGIIAICRQVSDTIIGNSTGITNANGPADISSFVFNDVNGQISSGESLTGELVDKTSSLSSVDASTLTEFNSNNPSDIQAGTIALASDNLIQTLQNDGLLVTPNPEFTPIADGILERVISSAVSQVGDLVTVTGVLTQNPRAEVTLNKDGQAGSASEFFILYFRDGGGEDNISSGGQVYINPDGSEAPASGTGNLGEQPAAPTTSVEDMISFSSGSATPDGISDIMTEGAFSSISSGFEIAIGSSVNDGLGWESFDSGGSGNIGSDFLPGLS